MRWRLWAPRPAVPSSASARGDGARAAARDWASLPAIQRSVGAARLTAESVSFVRALPGRRPLDVAAARLGHVRSREAPAGLLVARAMAAGEQPAPRLLDLLLLRPWRRAPVPQRAVEEEETTAVPEPPSATEAGPDAEAPASSDEAPAPVVLRLARAVAVPERIATAAPSLTQAPRVELEAAAAQPVVETPLVEPPAPPALPKAEEGAPRLNLGQSRRLGLGLRPSQELPPAQRQTLAVESHPPEELSTGSVDPTRPAQAAEPTPAEASAGRTPGAVEPAPPAGTAPVLQRRQGHAPPSAVPVEMSQVAAQPHEGSAGPAQPIARPMASPHSHTPATTSPAGSRMTKPIMRVQRRAADAPPEPLGPGGTSTPAAGRPESGETPSGSRRVTLPLAVPPQPVPQEWPEAAVSRATETPGTSPTPRDVAGDPAAGQLEPVPAPSHSASPVVGAPLVFRATMEQDAASATRDAGPTVLGSPPSGVVPPLVSRARESSSTSPGSPGVPGATPSRSAGRDVPPPLVIRATTSNAVSSPADDVTTSPPSEGQAASGVSVDDVAPIAGQGQVPPLPPLVGPDAVDSSGEPGEIRAALLGRTGIEPPPPLVSRATSAGTATPSAGTVQVLPLTGSRPPLVAPAAGPQARPSVQRLADVARLAAPPSLASLGPAAVDGPWTAARSVLEAPVPAPGRPARPQVPVQALSRPGTPSLPSLPTAPDPESPVPRRAAEAPAELARDAETLPHTAASVATGGLRSVRRTAESMAGEVGAAGQAVQSAAGQEAAAARQAVQHAAGQTGLPGSEAEVDALAGRLYDRIRSRLRSELLIGRERAGRITDLR